MRKGWQGLAAGALLVAVGYVAGAGATMAESRGAVRVLADEVEFRPCRRAAARNVDADEALPHSLRRWLDAKLGGQAEHDPLLGAVYTGALPNGLELWLAERRMEVSRHTEYWLLVRDPEGDRLGQHGVVIPHAQLPPSPGAEPPRIEVVGLDGLAACQIAVHLSGHSGTLYSARKIRCFDVLTTDDAPRLAEVLEFDAVLRWPSEDPGVVRRWLSRDAGGDLRVDVGFRRDGEARLQQVGGCRLQRDVAGEPFVIRDVRVRPGMRESWVSALDR